MQEGSWTNPSVKRLGAKDPVREIVARAQRLVSSALDAGWNGPPFDPVVLASILKIPVVPSDDVRDARTLPGNVKSRLQIQFNPNRSPARVRFSIAHEIAHTLFPDCGDFVRNRAAYHELTSDSWQLESLCNLAAAEFLMPAGTLPEHLFVEAGIEELVAWKDKYGVSMEAMLLRVTKLATGRCATFCASAQVSKLNVVPRSLRIDYAVSSSAWAVKASRGLQLPASSVVGECDSVGFTGERDEAWSLFGEVRVACIALPPYPGSIRPRVVGLVRPRDSVLTPRHNSLFQVVRGDATRPRGAGAKVVVQVVNDATPNWGGRGFASALRKTFPEAQESFRHWAMAKRSNLALGMTHMAPVAPGVLVASLIAQKGYGESVRPRIRYSALRQCLSEVADRAIAARATVHMPRIGAGQARGSWDVIEGLIRELLCSRGIVVTVYDLPGSAVPTPEQPSLGF
jgi:hypothetical protein